jgi:TatD DNase family protein
MIIDTHCHLYLEQFQHDLDHVISNAISNDVQRILLPNIDLNTIPDMLKLCEKQPELFRAMIGLHPCDVTPEYPQILETMKPYLSNKNVIAIGETGIDLHWEKETLGIQIESFEIQIEWAKSYNLPIVIHARESFQEIFDVLKQHDSPHLRGVFHCFTGGKKEVEEIMSLNKFYFGIGGNSTYPKKNYGNILTEIPQDRIVLETDAPFLSPVPNRGKRNEPQFIKYTAEFVANALGIELKELTHLTSKNAIDLFGPSIA